MQYYSDELLDLAQLDPIVAECMQVYPEDPIEGMHEMVLRLSGSYRVTVEMFKRVAEIMK